MLENDLNMIDLVISTNPGVPLEPWRPLATIGDMPENAWKWPKWKKKTILGQAFIHILLFPSVADLREAVCSSNILSESVALSAQIMMHNTEVTLAHYREGRAKQKFQCLHDDLGALLQRQYKEDVTDQVRRGSCWPNPPTYTTFETGKVTFARKKVGFCLKE